MAPESLVQSSPPSMRSHSCFLLCFPFPSTLPTLLSLPCSPCPSSTSPFGVSESSSLTLWVLLVPIHWPISIRASHLTSLGLGFPVYKMMGAVGRTESQMVLRVPASSASLRSEALACLRPGAWAGLMKNRLHSMHARPRPLDPRASPGLGSNPSSEFK